jgi:hypothetical protein
MSDEAAGATLVSLLSAVAKFDHVVVFAYRGEERPIHVFSTFDEAEFDIFVSQYLVGPYLLDPFYRNTLTRRGGVWRMRELAPDRFFSSEYYRSYYSKTALAEEIGFFVALESGISLVISLMRREATGGFTPAEFAQVRKAAPLVGALCQRHWPDMAERFAPERKSSLGTEPRRKCLGALADNLQVDRPRVGHHRVGATGTFIRVSRPATWHLHRHRQGSPPQRLPQARHLVADTAVLAVLSELKPPQPSSGTMSIAPHGHSAAQMPQPLQ